VAETIVSDIEAMEGVGEEREISSSPCRNERSGLKTEGFEGGAKRRRSSLFNQPLFWEIQPF
jgi:hypothetical protein